MRFKSFLLAFAVIILLIALSFQYSYAQGRDRSKFGTGFDTSTVRNDTSKFIDTNIVKVPVDSTARIKNFKYDRKDDLTALFGQYQSSILMYSSSQIERKIIFDSLNNVILTEKVYDEDIKYPVKIPFDKYLEIQSELSAKNQLYKIVAENYKIETTDELEQLFKNITEISIPLWTNSETIFGPPVINLKINGVIDITASYQRTSTDDQSILQQPTQNNINFKQDVQVSTKGTVGDKLTIDADWNSQRTFDFENQLKLKYKGYPDEVVQSIEAGNVSLETKSNLIGSTQALFGVKAQFKLGPLTLTTIASQKKSEKKTIDITGGSVETPFDISITQYAENNYLLDTSYAHDFETYFANGSSSVNISRIEVWVYAEPNNPQKRSAVGLRDITQRPVNGYTPGTFQDSSGYIRNGNFIKLNESEFTYNPRAGFITLNNFTPSSPKDAILVAYSIQNGNQNIQYGDFVNDVDPNATLNLKLIRDRSQQSPRQNPSFTQIWKLMLKNIYNLGVRNIRNDPSNLVNFKVVKKPSGVTPLENYLDADLNKWANGKSYMYLTGIDRKTNGNPTDTVKGGDGQFDFFPGNTIDLINGNVIFPTMKPFSDAMISKGVIPDSLGANDSIYYNSKGTLSNGNFPIIFSLIGSAKGDASNRYSLGFNVVEGSVKVFNGSVELSNGSDYTIDYSTGELLIRNASALSAGANLKITYESNDLFQLASKTLLGTRAELQINKTSYIGFTLVNLKQQTLNDKIRIGEEPTNNTILGFDAATDIKTNFLTKLVNKIPGYNTKEESLVSLHGEIAYMLPDPNTKKSRIPSDNGESVAYIDDFEGAKKLIPLGLNPLSWTLGSLPVDETIVSSIGHSSQEIDSLMSNRRSMLNWYTLTNDVPIKEVYPQRSVASNQNQNLSPFVFDIKPTLAGTYNFLTQTKFQQYTDIRHNWSGVFKYLNTSQTNLIDENINYIEVWMKVGDPNNFGAPVFDPGDSAKMIIDLGTISEKIIGWSIIPPRTKDSPRTNYHTEDYNLDGQLSLDEDNGIDGYPDAMETALSNQYQLGLAEENPGDPFRDDFAWVQGSTDFSKFNGTEGNARNLTEAKKIDQENVSNTGILNTTNAYLEYVIPLKIDSSTHNPYINGGGNNGWYQFVIPLSEFKNDAVASSILTNVQYARVWFKGFDKTVRIKIADMNLVGNQWVKLNKADTTYNVGVVSIEENPNIYQSPVGGDVLRQQDPSQTDQTVLSNEQSISMEVSRLQPGQNKMILKNFGVRSLNLINYKILKLFVNGDPNFKYISTTNYDARMIIRIGTDSANYYEYRAPIHPDQRPGQPWNSLNEVSITLADLTAIKQSKDSTQVVTYKDVPNGPPGSQFGIKGNPSITTVQQIFLGVENNNSNPITANPITGTVWFNEMRVLKTNNDNGYAFTLGAHIKVADLALIDISYSKTDPNFHNLETPFGNLNNTNAWEIAGTVNMHKILNALLSRYVSLNFKNFFNLPVTFAHREEYIKPLYIPGSDVNLDAAIQSIKDKYSDPAQQTLYSNQLIASTQTLTVTNRFSVNGFKLNLPGTNYFVDQLLNKLEVSFAKNTISQRTPTYENKYAWDMSGSIGLSSNIPLLDKLNLNIGKYLPFGDEFKNAKLYFFFPYMPLSPLFTNSLSLGTGFTRNHGDEKLRAQLAQNPTTRSFNATRNFTLDWKFIEGWIIDVNGNYSFNAGSDLTYLETTNDSLRQQRANSQIYGDIFFSKDKFINFGKDLNYTQTISINPKFNIPYLRNFLDLTATYRSAYGWRANDISSANGNTVGYNSDFQSSAFVKLNQIFSLFKKSGNFMGLQGGAKTGYQDDKRSFADIIKLIGTFIPDQVTVTYSQTKNVQNSGVPGKPGFANFWMELKSKPDLGPSRLYQLGWVTDPGKRVPGLDLGDALGGNSSVSFNTFINPIFPNNLKISFQYKLGKINNATLYYHTDDLGNTGAVTSLNETRTESRPTFFIGSNVIQKLGAPYLDPSTQAKTISDNFESNVVTFPFPTWNLTLTGIEKFEMFSGFASSITLESGYTSEYTKNFNRSNLKDEYLTTQTLNTGFSPLIGVSVTFKPISDGNLTASFKLNKTDNYTLNLDNANLTNNATSDLSLNASYTKSGFNLPLFGLALKNDLTISLSYTRTNNNPVVYTYNSQSASWEPSPQNGSISTSLNPSIQYALSRSVALQVFYKYTKVEPTQGTLTVTTRRSNEAGLNVKLTIQ